MILLRQPSHRHQPEDVDINETSYRSTRQDF